MEIYLLIGVIYAFFNRNGDLGIYGFIRNVALWPFDIFKNVWVGWNKAKNKDSLVTKANIKLCHESMEEFHNTLADIVLNETGKGLAEQPKQVRAGMLTYEIQAALAAAKKFRLEKKHHRDFAAATLTRGGISHNESTGMVDLLMCDSSKNELRAADSINGAEGYEVFTLGSKELEKHIKNTLQSLQN